MNWDVINPQGEIVATAKDAIHGWACIGGFKPTVEGLLGYHDQGWRVVPSAAEAEPLYVREVQLTAPKRIHLNVSDDIEYHARAFPRDPHGDEVTWSEEAALECTVAYVRADLAALDKACESASEIDAASEEFDSELEQRWPNAVTPPPRWRMVCGDWRDELVALHGPSGHIVSGLTIEQASALIAAHGGIDAAMAKGDANG